LVELATTESARAARRGGSTLERLRSALTTRGLVRRPEPRVRFGQPVLPGLAALKPGDRDAAASFVAQARALREGEVTHLGRTVKIGQGKVDWFPRDTSAAWQSALHGLDELLAIAVAAATSESAEERRSWYELATALQQDWVRRVPKGHAVAWSVPALARRVRNLLLVQAIFAAELRKDTETRRELLADVYEHATVLAAGIAGRTPDAWLIAAGHSLFLAGRFFDGMEARTWVEAGTTILWGQLREQVQEDGGHQSRSPIWQAFVLGEYLCTLAVLRADNDDVPVWGRKRVKGMADCLARLAHPDGSLPAFDAIAVDGAWTVRELLATAAVLLHEPGFTVARELPGVWPLLALGDAGRRQLASLGRGEATAGPRALRRTRFFVLAGDPGDAMIIDGLWRTCADGPAAFGYELSIGGLPLVVASPVGADEPGAFADHARSVRSKNVLAPDGYGTGDPVGGDGHLTVRDGVQYFLGTCQGFAGAGPEVRYRRRLFCLPGRFFLVCDEIAGTGAFAGESLVHLHPDVSVRGVTNGHPVIRIGRTDQSSVTLHAAGVKSVGLVGGLERPEPQGWYARESGAWQPAPVVAIKMAGTLPLLTGYLLVPRSDGVPAEVQLEGNAFELRATVRLGDVVHELTAVQDEVGLVTRPA
jgi:hypothetical protein